MSEELKRCQVRHYAPHGVESGEWRVIQEIFEGGDVAGGGVYKHSDGRFFVWYVSSGSWPAHAVGSLIMTWSEAQLRAAENLGKIVTPIYSRMDPDAFREIIRPDR